LVWHFGCLKQMKWLLRVGLVAFISANSQIFFRAIISTFVIFILNLLYQKYEALLLVTNPDKLFIPLYAFTGITLALIIWTVISLKSLSSLSESKKFDQVKQSYQNKPNSFAELANIEKHPKLKTRSENILNK